LAVDAEESAGMGPALTAKHNGERFGFRMEARVKSQGETYLPDHFSTLLLNSATQGIWSIGLDGLITFVNKAAVKMFGFSGPEQMLGRHSHELVHYKRADGTPYPKEECPIYRAFLKGEYVHLDNEVLWRADGSSFHADYRSVPILANGSIIGAVVTFTDITEKIRMQGELDERQKQLSEAAKIAKLGFWSIDLPTLTCNLSPQLAIDWGLDPNAFPMTLEAVLQLVHPDDVDFVKAKINEAIRGDRGFILDCRIICPSGEVRWVESRSQTHFRNGVPYLITGPCVDITDRKCAEANLLRAREALAFVIAHDLRNPIQAISLQAEIALRRARRKNSFEAPIDIEELQLLIRNSDELGRLADDILQVARLQTNTMILRKTNSDLLTAVKELLDEMRVTLGERDVSLQSAGDSFFAQIDLVRFRQIVMNLIVNAIKWSPQQTPIEITVSQLAQSIEVAVRDHGAGIPDELLPGIFEKFDAASAMNKSGAGLGHSLYVTKGLVEIHGGKIWAESALAQGSTLHVSFPA
jgi:PAS domain S-box-containing protein